MRIPKALVWVAFALLACHIAAGAVYAQAMKIATADVAYDQGNAKAKGYLAKPADMKARPALILIHEWWGLNDNIRENARQFAELGYVALAVDLYNGEFATDRDGARKLAGGVRKDPKAAFANLQQAVSYLTGLKGEVDPARIASVGWCFGGGWSYQMAKNDLGVKASVIYYGRFNPKDDLSRMRATILGHFGEKDRGIKVDGVPGVPGEAQDPEGRPHGLHLSQRGARLRQCRQPQLRQGGGRDRLEEDHGLSSGSICSRFPARPGAGPYVSRRQGGD